jgi:TolA-binding protein
MRALRTFFPAFSLFLLTISAVAQTPQAPAFSPGTAAEAGSVSQPAASNAKPAEASSTTADSGKAVICEVTTHEGELIPLRQCISKREADRRRLQQQESIREFQMQSFGMGPH